MRLTALGAASEVSSTSSALWERISAVTKGVPGTSFPALLASPSILRNLSGLRKLHLQTVKHGIRYIAFQIFFKTSRFSCFLEASGVFTKICSTSGFFSDKVQFYVSFRGPNHSNQFFLGKGLHAAQTASFRLLSYLLGNVSSQRRHLRAYFILISILYPVRRAASRAF